LKKVRPAEPKKSPWPDRLRRMKEHQDRNSTTWDRNEKMLFGQIQGQTYGQWAFNRPLAVGFAWGLVTTLETQIYEQDPDCLVDPRDPRWRDAAKVLTDVCRYDFSQMDVKSSGNLGLIDNMVCGYYASIETVESEKKPLSGEVAIRYPAGAKETKGEKEGDEKTPPVIVTDQNYVTNRIVPRDFVRDPQGLRLDLSDDRYIAVAFYPTIDSLKNDPTFASNLPSDIDDYNACSAMTRNQQLDGMVHETVKYGAGGGSGIVAETDPEYKTICVWEIWDKVNREIVYVTDWKRSEIGTRDWPFKLQLGGRRLFPVTLMGLWPVTTSPYPKPLLDVVWQQMTVLNTLDQQLYSDLVTKDRKIAYDGRVFTADQAARITDPQQPHSHIAAEPDAIGNPAGLPVPPFDITRAIIQLPDVGPAKDVFAGIAHVKNEMQEILGWGPMDRGGLPSVRSAREAVFVTERQERRIGKLADRVADYYRLIGAKHIQILQQTMAVDRYTRIMSKTPDVAPFLKYSKEFIQGDFEFVVYSGSSMPKTTEAKKAQVLQMFQTIAPIILQSGKDITPLLFFVAPYFDWDGIDEILKNPKDAGKLLAMTLVGMQQGQVPPTALLNAAAQAVQSLLTPEDLAALKEQMAGQLPRGGGPQGIVGQRGDPNALGTGGGNL
jgi:hypothetical protein